MTTFLMSVAEITVTMSAVILILLLLFKLFGRRMKAKSRYIILVIVMIRLALPISIPEFPAVYRVEISDVEVDTVIAFPAIPATEELPAEADTVLPQVPIQPQMPSASVPPSVSVRESSWFEQIWTAVQSFTVENWARIGLYIYLFMAAVFFVGSLSAHLLYVHRVKKGRTLGEEHIYPLYADVCRKKQITNPPLIWMSRAADSPMIIGLFIPRLLLPVNIDETALDGMLAHELKHYTRRDLWVKFICLVARSIHWFNPLVHIAAKRCMQEMELSCDDAVLAGYSLEQRQQYGFAMLNVVRNCQNQGVSLTTHFSPRKAAVKERFSGIVDMRSKRRGVWLIALAFVLCLASGVLLGYTLKTDAAADLPDAVETTAEPVVTTVPTTVSVPETTAAPETTVLPETTVPSETTVLSETDATTTAATKPPVQKPKETNRHYGSDFTVIEYSTPDRSQIYWRVSLEDGTTFEHHLDAGSTYIPSVFEIITVTDVNFDKMNDVLMYNGSFGVHGIVYYDCYLNTGISHVYCPSFSEIPNPVVDVEKHVVQSTYRQDAATYVTELYVYQDGVFSLQDQGDTAGELVYFTDFSSVEVLEDFKAFRGEWEVRDGRLWLKSVDAKDNTLMETGAFLLYAGEAGKELTDYQVDVDLYNVQTQTGVLLRCDVDRASADSGNAFYGYFGFVSKTGKRGAIGYGNNSGNWGGNLFVSYEYLERGSDLHLCVTASGDTIRCVYTDLHTGEAILDITSEFHYWTRGTFGFRMLSLYEGVSSLSVTSFDNLRVTKLP